ncbi:hypothetical protein P3T35_003693 [Kitasatospora sp. GP30]|uniref:glycoside hydrolase family 113 n=1 Tax=Kitasatospora sp. GP30 TaxID=3035084 RepID=UPI000C71285B|nr:hypothetical protein [Kitasatospora sp. GP30]MDH6141672.1 hypothetical protein [Kitasatospora sp. GP30]
MKRYIVYVLPIAVVAVTAAVPVLYGDHPINFDRAKSASTVLKPGAGTASAAPTAQPGATASAQPSADTGPKVAKPWQAGMPEWGIQVYWLDDPADADAYVQGKADRIVKYVVGLNANAIAVSFPFYTTGLRANAVSAHPTTPSPDRLGILIDTARRAGLKVTVRPIMDEAALDDPAGDWRGTIAPTDRDAWFGSYESFLQPYLKSAQKHGAASFTIGTEFNSLESDAHWQTLISDAKQVFHGDVGYDANWDNFTRGDIPVPAESQGVDAYFPAKSATDQSPVSTLVNSWNTWLDKKGKGPLPGVTLSEVGIPAQQGAYAKPGDFTTKRTVNEAVQAKWFTAVCQVAAQRQLAGMYLWSLYFGTDPTLPVNDDTPRMDFAGRAQSEAAIRQCFSGSYEVPEQPAG